MFYVGGVIYSHGHHFPIAVHRKDARGKPYILFTTRAYSVSTGKHITYTWRAIPAESVIYFVDNVEADSKHLHKLNYVKMQKERAEQFGLASRARKYASSYLATADRIRRDMNRYSKAFKLGYRTITSEMVPEESRKAVERAKALMLAKDKQDKIKIRKWLNFETDSAPHTRTPYVRVTRDSGVVQTSHGIRVPKAKAIALFKLATKCKARGRAYVPTKIQKIDYYKINSISDKGTLKIGCYIIPLSVQRLAAKMIGLYP